MKKFWSRIASIAKHEPVFFAIVADHSAHSPGRRGARLFATDDDVEGTIGGGIMEYNLLEEGRELLSRGKEVYFLKEKIHRDIPSENASGLFCAGSQKIVYGVILNSDSVSILTEIEKNENTEVAISAQGLQSRRLPHESLSPFSTWIHVDEVSGGIDKWVYKEMVFNPYRIAIIGGGHVGLALSKVMHELNYYIELFDTRETPTIKANLFANKLNIVDSYSAVGTLISHAELTHVVILTSDFQSDSEALEGLEDLPFPYVGLMGSQAKIAKIEKEVSPSRTQTLHAPIGLKIGSGSPQEIAISIAAEIISLRHELFPWTRPSI